MKMTGNTILITGGGTGIGRGLAEALHALGNNVIITGRRVEPLQQVATANAGIVFYQQDVEDPTSIQTVTAQIVREHPELNVLINMAGIMQAEDLQKQTTASIAEHTVGINLLGPIRMNTALLPHLLKQKDAVIMNVSSGLATVPLAVTPTYCATKAAIHSYTDSLRYQLRGTSVEVIELTPPYVATELMAGGTDNPAAMPLGDYIRETVQLLGQQPTPKEILVERVLPLRNAVANGTYDNIFEHLNEVMKHV